METLEEIEAALALPCWTCGGAKYTFDKEVWCRHCGGSGLERTVKYTVTYYDDSYSLDEYPCASALFEPPYLWDEDELARFRVKGHALFRHK